jgi:hypothetical protein
MIWYVGAWSCIGISALQLERLRYFVVGIVGLCRAGYRGLTGHLCI